MPTRYLQLLRQQILFPILLCCLSLVGLTKSGRCVAAVFTWTGTASSDWFTANNWAPAGVPGANDMINFTNGTIALTQSIELAGTFNWSGGSLSGASLTIAGGGALNINGGVVLENVLTNAGTVRMTGTGTLSLYNNGSTYSGGVYNLAGALWDIQTNASLYCACYGHEFFSNAGLFRKSQGSGTSTIQMSFANSGTVSNLVGTLNFAGNSTISGSYDVAAGATIEFTSGNLVMDAPPQISGSGLFEFIAGTLTLNETVPANLLLAGGSLILGPAFQDHGSISNLTLNGSTLVSSNTVTGTLSWHQGTIAGALTVAPGAELDINGGAVLENALTNAGTVTMTGSGTLSLYNNGSTYSGGVYNLAGALWDIQTNASLYCACYGQEFFNNAGVFRKSQGSGTSTIQMSFANSGTVSNLAGALNFAGNSTISGSFDVAAGATIEFTSGKLVVDAPPQISGSGLFEFIAGTLTLNETVPANLLLAGGSLILGPAFQNHGSITNLTLSGSTLVSSNTVTGTFSWHQGTIAGALTVAPGAELDINGGVVLENILTNSGTVTMTGTGTLSLYNNGTTYLGGIYNLPGALWDLQTNASLYCACYGQEFFNNAGVFRKSQGSGTSTIQMSFANSGTVSNLVGTLNFAGNDTISGSYDVAAEATIEFTSGNLTMDAPPQVSGSGLFEFIAGTLTLNETVSPNLLLAGGSLILGPAFQNNGAITNLTLSGATLVSTNTVTGTLSLHQGTIVGVLNIATNGKLDINGGAVLENALTNAGTVTMTGTGTLSLYNNGTTYFGGVDNLPGALWDIQTNASLYCACYGNEFFINGGVFRKSLGLGTSTIQMSFANAGTVNALAGTLSFTGAFTDAGGTLGFGVSGLSSFGKINVVNSISLNGAAEIAWLGGFLPAVGNSFGLLNYGSHSGTFAKITFPPGTLGQGLYSNSVFSVLVTGVTAQASPPTLNIAPAGFDAAVVSWPTSVGSFGLQTSASLSPANWSSVTTGITIVGTNNVFTVVVNGKTAFFRLKSQ